MSIVTFWNGCKEQCGSTSSAIAFATQLAIDHNIKTLLVSTSLNDLLIKEAFFENKKKSLFGNILRTPQNSVEKGGVEGLDRIIRSNRITPDIITDYTTTILTNRLEILLGMQGNGEQYDIMKERYAKIITLANQYYDMVIVDLDKRLGKNQTEILQLSDVVVAVLPQKINQMKKVMEFVDSETLLTKEKTVYAIGKYMANTKYNAKNLTRSIIKQKTLVNTIPYNNLFFEASQEGNIIDLFLNLMRIKDKDENFEFVKEIKRLIDTVKERIEILRAN